MAEKYKLTYFNIKGLAEPIRMIFAVAEVDYEDVRIEKDNWANVKKNYDWGQLPVLEIGDKKLAQSNAIGRYLSKKFKLAGSDDWEAAKMDELVDVLTDIRSEWRKFFMEQDVDKKAELKKAFIEIASKKFDKLEVIKKENGGKFLVGKSVSWADITISYSLGFFEQSVDATILDNYPELKALQQNVFNLPQIKAWIEKRPETAM